MSRRRRTLALVVMLPVLLLGVQGIGGAASADADELRVVAVLPQPDGRSTSVVAEVHPTPTAPLSADAAEVTIGGAKVPATTAPLLEPAAPTAVVLDDSGAGAGALPQALSGAAGFLLRLPTNTPVTFIADTTSPKNLTSSPVQPVDAIHLFAGLRPGGVRSTAAALDLALSGLRPAAGARSLVLLQTTGPAPADAAGIANLSGRLRAARAVLAVVTSARLAAGWTAVAQPTGGFALAATPDVPTAFDNVGQMLGACSVVTFTPPSGAASASLRVRAGGSVLPAEVPLTPASAAPSPGASSGQSPGNKPTAAPSSGKAGGFADAAGGILASLVLLALVAATVLLLWRQQLARRETAPDALRASDVVPPAPAPPARDAHDGGSKIPAKDRIPVPLGGGDAAVTADDASLGSDEQVPAGVRLFDVSDPAGPVEIERGERESAGAEAEPPEAEAEPAEAEPEPEPVAAAEPEPVHVEALAPEPEPVAAAEPEPVHVEALAPEPEPVAAAEPEPVPVEAPEPEPEPVAAAEPEPVPVKAPEPEPEPVAAAEPEPVPVEAAEPEPVPVEAAEPEPEPVHVEAAEPEPVSAEAAEPEPEQVPAEAAEPEPVPAEAAVPQPVPAEGKGVPWDAEVVPALLRPDAMGSPYVGHHRQGRHRPRLRPKSGESDDESKDPDRRDRSA